MAAIYVGAGATVRDSGYSGAKETFLLKTNPANLSGIIDTVEIWVRANMDDLYVGFFYLVSGTTYKCRSAVALGAALLGAKRTFPELSLSVVLGDLIGAWWGINGEIARDTEGGGGLFYTAGDTNLCVVDAQQELTEMADWEMSLYGIGISSAVAAVAGAGVAAELLTVGQI